MSRRLSAAAKIVSERGGLLVLVVDAADNAVIAGQKRDSASFVPGLWSLSLPDNARLVMTARTHRREGLEASCRCLSAEAHRFR